VVEFSTDKNEALVAAEKIADAVISSEAVEAEKASEVTPEKE
jgi:hypothetical protein